MEEFGPSKSVLDSSTVTAGLLIQRRFRKVIARVKERIRLKHEAAAAAGGSGTDWDGTALSKEEWKK